MESDLTSNKTCPALLDTIAGRILLGGLFLGLAFDTSFYGKGLGISLPLYLLLMLATLFWLGRSKGLRPQRHGRWLLLPLFMLGGMVALRSNPFLTFLNLVAVLCLLALIVHFYARGRLALLGLLDYPAVLLTVAAHTLFDAAPLIPAGVDLPAVAARGRRHLFPLLRGLLLGLPLLLLFSLLLASADLVFARYLGRLLELDFIASLLEGSWRALLVLLVAWLTAGSLAYALLRADGGRQPFTAAANRQIYEHVSLGFVEAATVLTLVDALFLLFVAIQFAYLFGSHTYVAAEGYSYAEYARRGFFELLAVALLTLGLILGLSWLTQRPGPRRTFLFNILSSLMVALVLVMLASAFYRLQLYEESYGYTHLRLYVHVFMVWLGLLLGWFLLTLWRGSNLFAVGAFLAALGCLLTLNALNPDAFIARQNLIHYEETGRLDPFYLAGLSADALPAVLPALDQIAGEEREILCRDLYREEAALLQPERRSWSAFHLGRWRAEQALAQHPWRDLCPQPEEQQ